VGPGIVPPVETSGAVAGSDATADDVIRLTRAGRGRRVLLLLVLASLFLAGTAVGQDDWWPFGPWRMFANSTSPSGSVYSLRIEVQDGRDPTWRLAPLSPSSVGLNRAEVEGRIPAMTADPAILGTLARSHSRLRPDEPAWRAVRVVRSEVLLSGGSPTGAVRDTPLVEWTAP
jgi:hypothetical protein